MFPYPHLKAQPTIESVAKCSKIACRQFLSQWRLVLEISFLSNTNCNNQVRSASGTSAAAVCLLPAAKRIAHLRGDLERA